MQTLEIQSIDHIVIQAADLAATIKFYTEILGMEHSSFQPPTGGPVRQSLHFGLQKINSVSYTHLTLPTICSV